MPPTLLATGRIAPRAQLPYDRLVRMRYYGQRIRQLTAAGVTLERAALTTAVRGFADDLLTLRQTHPGVSLADLP